MLGRKTLGGEDNLARGLVRIQQFSFIISVDMVANPSTTWNYLCRHCFVTESLNRTVAYPYLESNIDSTRDCLLSRRMSEQSPKRERASVLRYASADGHYVCSCPTTFPAPTWPATTAGRFWGHTVLTVRVIGVRLLVLSLNSSL